MSDPNRVGDRAKKLSKENFYLFHVKSFDDKKLSYF